MYQDVGVACSTVQNFGEKKKKKHKEAGFSVLSKQVSAV